MKKTARELMSHPVLAAREDWSVRELAAWLVEKAISGAPVLSANGRLTGVVSLNDIVDQITGDKEPSGAIRRPRGWESRVNPEDLSGLQFENGGRSVADIMTPTFFTVPEETPLPELARTMVAGRIHRLLVTRRGHVVGIVTTLDLLREIAGKARGRRTRPSSSAKHLALLAHAPAKPEKPAKKRRRA